jgi:hypothetical protein
VSIFADGLFPKDIRQGNLSYSYFLSAIAVLTEQPKNLRRLYLAQEINNYGCYAIWLCKDGEWSQFVIDDNFPC